MSLTHDLATLLQQSQAKWSAETRTIMDQATDKLAERVTVGKVHVGDHSSLAAHYGIRSIPTLPTFKDGEVVDRAIGVVPKQTLIDKLQGHLAV